MGDAEPQDRGAVRSGSLRRRRQVLMLHFALPRVWDVAAAPPASTLARFYPISAAQQAVQCAITARIARAAVA
jgi:hypothetical protein